PVRRLVRSPCPRPASPPLFPYTPLFRSRCVIRRHDGTATPVLLPEQVAGNRLSLPASAIDFDLLTDDPWIEPARLMFGPSTRLRSEEHTSELQSRENLVCRLLLQKNNID